MKLIISFIFSIFLYSSVSAPDNTIIQKPRNFSKYPGHEKDISNLPLNHIQVIGSHNSYKQAIDPPLWQMLKKTNANLAAGIDYSHISILEQLNMGLSNLEIDIYADTKGGKYAHPLGLDMEKDQPGVKPYDPEKQMLEPGFKIFHIQEIDFRSHYLTFKSCLQDLKKWSDAHPGHNPIFITMNAKDQAIDRPGYTVPEKFTPEVFAQLDQVIREKLGKDKLITPDQVRGKYNSLELAVLKGNWPKFKDAKGKFLFVLDENVEKRTTYIKDHSSLKGRVLFANAEPGTPEAAILILNDPKKDLVKIQALVKKGYIIRTRADANTEQARKNDRTQFEAACQSGAQIITTDYYQKSTHFASDYQVSFTGDKFFRPNPLFIK